MAKHRYLSSACSVYRDLILLIPFLKITQSLFMIVVLFSIIGYNIYIKKLWKRLHMHLSQPEHDIFDNGPGMQFTILYKYFGCFLSAYHRACHVYTRHVCFVGVGV